MYIHNNTLMDTQYKKIQFVISVKKTVCGGGVKVQSLYAIKVVISLKQIIITLRCFTQPNGKHKESMCRKYKKENEKRIKECQYKKKKESMNHKGRQKERKRDKKGTRQTEKNDQTENSKSFSVSNYFK